VIPFSEGEVERGSDIDGVGGAVFSFSEAEAEGRPDIDGVGGVVFPFSEGEADGKSDIVGVRSYVCTDGVFSAVDVLSLMVWLRMKIGSSTNEPGCSK
jgi:hypothetical protein